MKSRLLLALIAMAAALLAAESAGAAVPPLISYQGHLTDAVGTPLDTTLSLVFTVYADAGGSTSLWTETQPTVLITGGFFQVLLGSVNPIGISIFDGGERWLKVQIQGGSATSTLIPIVSVAYAHRAVTADTAGYALSSGSGGGSGWSDDGTAVRLTNITDNVGIGTSSPNARLEVRNSSNTGLGALIRNDNQANNDQALWVETNGNGAAIFGSSPYKYGVHGSSANSYGVYGTGGKGVYGFHIDSRHYGYLASGSYGVYGKDSTTGVWGAIGGGNAGVVGVGQGSSQVGIFGENGGAGVGIRGSSIDSSGVYGSSANKYGVFGTGSKGVFGLHPGTNHYGYLGSQNYGAYGKDSTTGAWGAIGGTNTGVYGEGKSTSSYGLYGYNTGGGIGILGGSADSIAIHGASASDIGVYGTGSQGVRGKAGNGNYGYLGSSDYGAYGEYKDSTNYGFLGAARIGAKGYSQNGYGLRGESYYGTGVYGLSNDGTAVYADGWIGDGLFARTGIGSSGYAGKFHGRVQIRCMWDCANAKALEVQGNTLLSQNDGELVLSTPTQNDPGRYRLKFDNNLLGVICGSDSSDQSFSFMSAWGANHKHDAHLKIHGRATGNWGKYIELYHDGTDG
ncbi:MAG: hypothetical protein E4G91_08005, partial [Candidatus Zixiibacteriota bacterium]